MMPKFPAKETKEMAKCEINLKVGAKTCDECVKVIDNKRKQLEVNASKTAKAFEPVHIAQPFAAKYYKWVTPEDVSDIVIGNSYDVLYTAVYRGCTEPSPRYNLEAKIIGVCHRRPVVYASVGKSWFEQGEFRGGSISKFVHVREIYEVVEDEEIIEIRRKEEERIKELDREMAIEAAASYERRLNAPPIPYWGPSGGDDVTDDSCGGCGRVGRGY